MRRPTKLVLGSVALALLAGGALTQVALPVERLGTEDDHLCLWREDSNDSDGNDSGLYRVPVAGGTAEPLQGFDRAFYCPSWSAATRRVVFAGGRNGGDAELFLARRDGSAVTRLTRNRAWDVGPVWAPAARRIAFTRIVEGESLPRATVMRIETRRSRTVARGRVEDWAPRGRNVLVARRGRVFVVNLRAGTTRRLTPRKHRYRFFSASWSTGGRRIALIGGRLLDGGDEPWSQTAIFTIRRNGSGLTRIAGPDGDMPFALDEITWFPDDSRLLFTGCSAGCRPYTIKPDGSDLTQIPITNMPEYDDLTGPSWIYR